MPYVFILLVIVALTYRLVTQSVTLTLPAGVCVVLIGLVSLRSLKLRRERK